MTAPRPAPVPVAHTAQGPSRPAAPAQAFATGHAPATATSRRWRSADLFGPEHEIEIEHGPSVYRLRLTSLGKLILTK